MIFAVVLDQVYSKTIETRVRKIQIDFEETSYFR